MEADVPDDVRQFCCQAATDNAAQFLKKLEEYNAEHCDALDESLKIQSCKEYLNKLNKILIAKTSSIPEKVNQDDLKTSHTYENDAKPLDTHENETQMDIEDDKKSQSSIGENTADNLSQKSEIQYCSMTSLSLPPSTDDSIYQSPVAVFMNDREPVLPYNCRLMLTKLNDEFKLQFYRKVSIFKNKDHFMTLFIFKKSL